MLLSYRTGSYIDYNFCNEAETDNLLANKVTYDYKQLKYTKNVKLSAIYYN